MAMQAHACRDGARVLTPVSNAEAIQSMLEAIKIPSRKAKDVKTVTNLVYRDRRRGVVSNPIIPYSTHRSGLPLQSAGACVSASTAQRSATPRHTTH